MQPIKVSAVRNEQDHLTAQSVGSGPRSVKFTIHKHLLCVPGITLGTPWARERHPHSLFQGIHHPLVRQHASRHCAGWSGVGHGSLSHCGIHNIYKNNLQLNNK